MPHAGAFRVPPEACYRAARGLDLLRDPVVRTLLGFRSLPQRLANRLSRGAMRRQDGPRPTFRLDDMIGPPLNWLLLAEEPGVQIVLGQIGRPWKPAGASEGPPVAPAAFASFDRPGFAKIAFCLKVEPYRAASSILTIETRVALIDPASRRRFARYWRVVGAFRPLDRPDDTSTAHAGLHEVSLTVVALRAGDSIRPDDRARTSKVMTSPFKADEGLPPDVAAFLREPMVNKDAVGFWDEMMEWYYDHASNRWQAAWGGISFPWVDGDAGLPSPEHSVADLVSARSNGCGIEPETRRPLVV